MEEVLAQYHPQDCIKCQACSRNCPSARNGGIVPHLVIQAVIDGKTPSDVWKCIQCQRCSSVCPRGIEVSEIILHYRCMTEMPEKMKKTIDIVGKYGRAVMPSPSVNKLRGELGLEDDDVSEETMAKIKDLMEGVR